MYFTNTWCEKDFLLYSSKQEQTQFLKIACIHLFFPVHVCIWLEFCRPYQNIVGLSCAFTSLEFDAIIDIKFACFFLPWICKLFIN